LGISCDQLVREAYIDLLEALENGRIPADATPRIRISTD
jgi:hypothetical protein